MNRRQFSELLKEKPLLLDGAMGTVLHDRGIPIDHCFDAINMLDPDLVASIHRAYISAGADVIETNTFGANRFKLANHGLEDQVREINQRAVTLARRVITAASKPVLLAGAVGPLGVRLAPLGRVRAREAEAAFIEQIAGLIDSPGPSIRGIGVDMIIIETMPDLKEISVAVKGVRKLSTEIPIIANMTFTRDDRTLLGVTAADAASRLAELDVDAIGINCSSGPVQVLRLIAMYKQVVGDLPLVAVPNAGWPQQEEGGRVLYPATPDYFARFAHAYLEAGACAVGGCCGTTAEHISAMRKALDRPVPDSGELPKISVKRQQKAMPIPADQPTGLDQALSSGEFVVTVEMSPPRGIAAQRLLEGARMLKEAGAQFIDVADSPLARMRMSAWAAAHLIQKEVDLEAVLHFPTRGRNLLRVQGDLLAAHALGIRNLFVVMGDPTQIGDYPEAMDNYDIVPTGLIQLITNRLNVGVDQAGRTIDQPTRFTVGCALNLEPPDLDHEIRLLRKKVKSGAAFALTQPVFNPERARKFIGAYQESYGKEPLPIVAGIQPLYNSGNAEFLHNEVPGIIIPEELRLRMRKAEDPQSEGVKIAQEIFEALRDTIQGVYMIPVFGRYDLVADVIDIVSDH